VEIPWNFQFFGFFTDFDLVKNRKSDFWSTIRSGLRRRKSKQMLGIRMNIMNDE
jgi:hypothetical protein